MTEEEFRGETEKLRRDGVQIGFFTMHAKEGWHCQLSQVKSLKFTNGDGATLAESLADALGKLEKIWAGE